MKAGLLQPLRDGLHSATRYWLVLAITYAVNIAAAASLTALPAAVLMKYAGHLTALRQAADGIDAWQVIDLVTSPLTDRTLNLGTNPSALTAFLQQGILLGLLTALGILAVAWLTGTFLAGGLFSTFAASPQPFRVMRFLKDCWHWFGVFLLLSGVQAAATLALFGIGAGLTVVLIILGWQWPVWLLLPVLVLVWLLLFAIFELTRVSAVVNQTRRIIPALREALRLLRRRPLALALLYGLTVLALVCLRVMYNRGVRPAPSMRWWPLALVLQQAYVLVRLWIRLVRTAGAVGATKQREYTDA